MRTQPSPALSTGIRATGAALEDWRRAPGAALGPWFAGSAAIAFVLLLVVVLIGVFAPPDRDLALDIPPVTGGGLAGAAHIFTNNLLVLALHAMACVAGFIAGASLPLEAERYHGFAKLVHERGARLAFGFVTLATIFSLSVQAISIGTAASSISAELHTSPPLLILCLLPHAIPELTALFLPLSAWLIASRRGGWDRLLAASLVTTVIALPILATAALWESLGAHSLIAMLH